MILNAKAINLAIAMRAATPAIFRESPQSGPGTAIAAAHACANVDTPRSIESLIKRWLNNVVPFQLKTTPRLGAAYSVGAKGVGPLPRH